MKCYNCENRNLQEGQLSCPDCGAYVHCCMNCSEYDQYAPSNCKAGKYEFDKKKQNFCDAFKPNSLGY